MTRLRRCATTITMVLAALAATGCGNDNEPPPDLDPISTDVNLVVNPGFEEWSGGQPNGWTLTHFSGEGERVSYFGRSEQRAGGEYSYFLRGLYNTQKWMALTQVHPVRPGYDVVFSADIKTENLKQNKGQERNANLYVRFLDADGERISDRYFADAWTERRTGTNDWKRDVKQIEVPAKARFVEIGLLNQMTGYIYFDNVELVLKERIEWQERKTRFITFRWLPGRPFPPEAMKRQAEMIEDIAKQVGVKSGRETMITYYLYPDEETFMKMLGRKKYSCSVHWTNKELHTVEEFNDHDIIYLILYELGFPPMGLSHGLGFHFRARYLGWDLHMRAREFLVSQRLPALYRTIDPKAFQNADASIVVPGWGSFVKYLIDHHGMDTLLRLYRESDGIEVVGPFSARFKSVYGVEFQELDRTWRLFLLRYEAEPAAGEVPGASQTNDADGAAAEPR